MKTIVLENMPHWNGYLLAAPFLAGFVAGGVVLVRRWRMAAQGSRQTRPPLTRAEARCVINAILAGFVSAIFITMMFFRFDAVSIGPDHVELRYYWPRPAARIPVTAVERVEVVPYQRRGGCMRIVTPQGVFRSVDFRGMDLATEVQTALAKPASPAPN